MTCFWDSIFSQLNVEDYKFIGHNKCNNIVELIRRFNVFRFPIFLIYGKKYLEKTQKEINNS